MLIVSYCNKETISYFNFINSLNKYNYNYKILGKGETWNGFMTKINAYYEYIKSLKRNRLICILDSYDVLACSSKKIKYGTCKIMVGSQVDCKDYNCIELNNWWKLNFLKKQDNNHYANSGFILGYSNNVLKLLQFMIESKESDDQMALCRYIEKYPKTINIDINSEYIATILPIDFHKYKWTNNKVLNTQTGKSPLFIHTPGISSDLYMRMDFFGERILGSKYNKSSLINKIPELVNKVYKNPVLYIKLLPVIILLLFYIFYKYTYTRKYIIFFLVLFIISYMKFLF